MSEIKQKSPTRVVTGKVRLSYVNVFAPKTFGDGQAAKYSVSVLIPKTDDVTLDKIRKAINAAVKEGVQSKWNGKQPVGLHLPLRDGDEERPDDPAYKGMYFFNAMSSRKPGVVDPELNAIIEPDELYSGCYGRVSVNFYPYNVPGNRGIAAGLNNIQKLADGKRLAGGSSAEEDFADSVSNGSSDFDF